MRVKIEMLQDWPDLSAKINYLKLRKENAARVKELEDGIACKKGQIYFVNPDQAKAWISAKIAKKLKITKEDR